VPSWLTGLFLGGIGQNSKLHCVGDGALCIYEQLDRVFGTQAGFLIDFYHLCDYLAAASNRCAPDHPSVWLEQQKQWMKETVSQGFLRHYNLI